MKQVSKASQLNKSVKQVSLASQVKQVGLASQVSNLPKSSQESEIKKVLVKQVQVKQVKSSKFKLSNLNQASEVMLDRDTAPRKRPSTRLSGKTSWRSLVGMRSRWITYQEAREHDNLKEGRATKRRRRDGPSSQAPIVSAKGT